MPIPRIWISKLKFSDNSELFFNKEDIVVIVGPNNSGKSATLRAIWHKLSSDSYSPVVSDFEIEHEGNADDVLEWLDSFTRKNDPTSDNPHFQAFNTGVQKNQVRGWWGSKKALHSLTRFFCHLLTGDDRLQAANPPPSIAVVRDPPVHPLHFLLRNEKLENKISEQFRKAFGSDLIVNRLGGNQVPLHVGPKPQLKEGQDRVSYEYVQELEKLPLLHSQGDGMRSFTGVLLYTSVGRESILLIDEPEAFLHPPQARYLGRTLVLDKPSSRQLFISTHSGDILRGVLDAGNSNVRVVRIRRSGDINHVRQLERDKISELWSDPLLRYSNILDGLFHEKVIVCESDSDARFYSAVADALTEIDSPNAHRQDLMFTHCGGKDRLAVVVRALREVDVPVSVAVDFDVLNNEQPLRSIVEAAGGEWSSINQDWKIIKQTIDAKKPELSSQEVVAEIQDLLSNITASTFPQDIKDSIQKIFRRSSPWATAKSVGKNFVPSGDATKAFDRLNQTLETIGIFIVPVGELECFVRSVGNHGPKWVNEVLKKDLKTDRELEEARIYVSALIGKKSISG